MISLIIVFIMYKVTHYNPNVLGQEWLLTLNRLRRRGWGGGGGAVNKTSPCGFSKGLEPWFFATFNIIMSHIFLENFIEVPQVVQKIWRFFSVNINYLQTIIDFSDFLISPCYIETNDVRI